jgi:hypothetical protein
MRRLVMIGFGLLLLLPGIAQAQTLCWSALPFVDVFRASGFSVVEVDPLTIAIPAWSHTGLDVYQIKGAAASITWQGVPFDFALLMVNTSPLFGGNPRCIQIVKLNAEGVGTAATFCEGGTQGPFSVTLNLAPMECPKAEDEDALMTQSSGPLAGEAEQNTYGQP